jgi:hypothetical protein
MSLIKTPQILSLTDLRLEFPGYTTHGSKRRKQNPQLFTAQPCIQVTAEEAILNDQPIHPQIALQMILQLKMQSSQATLQDTLQVIPEFTGMVKKGWFVKPGLYLLFLLFFRIANL